MKGASCALVLLAAAAATAQPVDLLNGLLPATEMTADVREQGDRVREMDTEIEWILVTNTVPKKRAYQNLPRDLRARYRALEREKVKAYWRRGLVNDWLRATDALQSGTIFRKRVVRDPCPMDPNKCKPEVKEVDAEVDVEQAQLVGWLRANPPGESLAALSNEEHLRFQQKFAAPFVGIGQRRIGYASGDAALVRDHMMRELELGPFKNDRRWSDAQDDLRGSLREVREEMPALCYAMDALPAIQRREQELLSSVGRAHDVEEHRSALAEKADLYRTIWTSGGASLPLDRLLTLMVDGEVLAAHLAEGQYTLSGRPGRNHLDGLALVVAGAARSFLAAPNRHTLSALGGVGVVGTIPK